MAGLSDVPGATLIEDFITTDEVCELESMIRYQLRGRIQSGSDPKFSRRFVYFRDGNRTLPVLPQLLQVVQNRVARALQIPKGKYFSEVFGNDYKKGYQLGAHLDGREQNKYGLANLTLLGEAPFTLARPGMNTVTSGEDVWYRGTVTKLVEFSLPERSLLVLRGEAVSTWMHGFKHLPCDRTSIVFRSVEP